MFMLRTNRLLLLPRNISMFIIIEYEILLYYKYFIKICYFSLKFAYNIKYKICTLIDHLKSKLINSLNKPKPEWKLEEQTTLKKSKQTEPGSCSMTFGVDNKINRLKSVRSG